LSSQNDEILIIAYKNQDILSEPLIMEYIIFDETQKLFNIPVKSDLFNDTELLVIMLEIDTELSPKEIEKNVRDNITALEDEFFENDRVALKTIIGDDDILGFTRISKETLKICRIYNFVGTYKLDRYEYELEFINIDNIE